LHPKYTIIHDNLSRMEDVTSSQTYQKGSWTLHMLRGVLGDDVFQRGIQAYYRRYFNGSATTADFRRAMEEMSGQSLGWFFEQWLYKPGSLRVAGRWRYDAARKQVVVTLEQTQIDGSLFTMPIEVAIYRKGDATPTVQKVTISAKSNTFVIDAPIEPEMVKLDPKLFVLMEATMERER
jgi:aminopeptidase N